MMTVADLIEDLPGPPGADPAAANQGEFRQLSATGESLSPGRRSSALEQHRFTLSAVEVVQFILQPAGGGAQLHTTGNDLCGDVNKAARLPDGRPVGLAIICDRLCDAVCVVSSGEKMEDVKKRVTEFSAEAHGQISTVSF